MGGRHNKFLRSDERSSDLFFGRCSYLYDAANVETGEEIAPLLDAVFSGGVCAAEILSVFGHPVDVTGGISTKDLSSNHYVVFVGR